DHWRMFDRGIDHSITIDVEAERCLPCRDVVQIVNWTLVPDELPFGFRFELERLRCGHRELRSSRNQSSISKLSVTRFMNHFVILRDTFRCRNLPLRRSRADKHGSGRCAGTSKGFIEVADRARSVGVLVAILRIA